MRQRFASTAARISLVVGYACLLLAGVAAVVQPPRSLAETTDPAISLAWGVLVAAGGLLGVVGATIRRPGLELLAGPLLFAPVLSYGITLLARQWATPGVSGTGTVVAWLLFGLSFGFVAHRFHTLLTAASVWRKSQ